VKGVKSSRTQTRRSSVSAGPTHTSGLCLVLYMYMHTKASGLAVTGHL
jgi:hypothetical protein